MQLRQNDLIDILRGIAIAGVIAVHSVFTVNKLSGGSDYNLFSFSFSLGKYGVELFFFISGYLMLMLYGLGEPINNLQYLKKRFLRIYPLWFVFLILGFVLNFTSNYGGVHSALNSKVPDWFTSPIGIIITTLTFTSFLSGNLWNTVIPGGWSIQVEVLHYLVFVLVRKKSLVAIVTFTALINFLTGLFQILANSQPTSTSIFFQIIRVWSRLSLYSSFPFFLIGICANYVIQSGLKVIRFELAETKSMRVAIGLFCLSLLTIPTPFGSTVEALGMLVVMVALGFVFSFTSKPKNLLISLGKYSFFMYFVHFLILDLLANIVETADVNLSFPFSQKIIYVPIYVITISLSWILGKISMRLFEGPLIKLSR